MASLRELSRVVGDLSEYSEKSDVEKVIRDRVSNYVRLQLIYRTMDQASRQSLMNVYSRIFTQKLIDDILSELCLIKSCAHH